MTRYYRIPDDIKHDLVEVTCAVCGGTRARTLGYDNGFRIQKCADPRCGFVYVNPRPSQQQLLKLYLDYYPQSDNIPEKWIAEMRDVFTQVARWLTSRQSRGRVLDVGCSFGHMLAEMEKRGWQSVGVEPSKTAADYAQKQLKGAVINRPFEEAQLERESFDALISLYVLEHVNDPRAFLTKCFELLRFAGQAVIRIPRTEPLMPVQRLLGRSLMYAPMHLSDFSPRVMQRLCRDIGFRTVEVRVGRARRSHDLVENAGALVLGSIGQLVEAVSGGTILFPWTGSLSYHLTK
ncbi:MAG: class I SAM-dependent methyltransferase [Deltaproteobacteria bacterium]|nr:class I SAM-dependent methyltransferase [Deltaproteobacteria bacterium]